MKSLLVGLLINTAVFCGPAQAASTDTLAGTMQAVATAIATDVPTFVAEIPVVVPPEQKVVEIHMSERQIQFTPERGRRRKIDILPLPDHSTCSGAFINRDGDILTAKHCVTGDLEFEVVTNDQRRYAAVIVATSSVHDLALIHIDRRNTPFFELASQVSRGETVYILGSPLGITDALSTGVIGKVDGDITYLDCAALPGNSGSTVFNQSQELVGVLTAGMIVYMGTTHLNVMQGLDAVDFFLEEVERKRDERR